MTCPGNHEWHYNFSNYKARFNMPGDENNNMFFSFDIGPVHFVSISTEFYYYLNYGMQQVIIKTLWREYIGTRSGRIFKLISNLQGDATVQLVGE